MAFDVGSATWVERCTDRVIAGSVLPATFARGLEYADAHVISLGTADRGRVLVAEVRGSGAKRYQTLVSRVSDGAEPTWTGRCSCPVGSDCKHCVAVLIAARRALESDSAMSPYAALVGADIDDLDGAEDSVHQGAAGGLFTGQAAWRGESVKTTPAWARALDPVVATPDEFDERPRTPLSVMLTQIEKASGRPGERVLDIAIRPTRMTRADTWTTSWGWDQALSPLGARGMEVDHVALATELCRIDQARSRLSSNHRPQSIDLGALGPEVWEWFARAVEQGIGLVAGPVRSGPARSGYGPKITARPVLRQVKKAALAPPVEVELDVTRRGDELAVRANLVGLPGWSEPVPASDALEEHHPSTRGPIAVGTLGHPVHGLVVIRDETLTLAPLQPVLPEGFEPILTGGSLTVPAADVDRFLSFYYPRLRRRLRVVSSDGSVELAEPEPIRLHLRVIPHTVGDIEVRASYAYPGQALVPVVGGGRAQDRDPGTERELVDRLDVLDLLPGLTERSAGGRRRVLGSVHVRGLDAADLVRDVIPEWEAHPDLIVETSGELAAYEESTEAPLIEWSRLQDTPGNDWLDLKVAITIGQEDVPLEGLLKALVHGDDVMLLDSGTWFSLDHPALDKLRELVDEARELGDPVADGLRVSRFHLDLFGELLDLGIVDAQTRDWAERMLAIRDGIVPEPAIVPDGVTATLRPYQREGFEWLATLWDARLGAVLADDMGLGKTLQTLAVVQRAKDRGELTAPVLVVAPTSVLSTWRDEAGRFTPGLSVALVGETSKRRSMELAQVVEGIDIVVTSYAVFRIDADAFRELPWRALVLDEAQTVKNSSSQTYQAARRLPAQFKMVVTGTPLENSLMDLWALLSIAAPGLYPRRDHFNQHYRKPIETGGDTELLERLRRRIRPIMLRRTKEAVASDLPPKQVQLLPVALHPLHQRIYDQHLQRERQRLLGLLDDPRGNRMAILASLTRLRQLSLDPALVDEAHVGKATSAKIAELIEHLTELRQEGHRALVFSQFTGYLKIVEKALADEGITTCYLDGRTRNRPEVIERFRTGNSTAFLISLKAGGVGLTLTEADYVFVLDPWWNPATEAQAVDRAHRIGQTRPVMVYRMVSTGTVEDKVVALQERKKELFDRVVEGGDPLGSAITADDLRALIEE